MENKDKPFVLEEKIKKLREKIRDDIFRWAIEEGGDKLHFNELVDEIFYDIREQDKEFIRLLKEEINELGKDIINLPLLKIKDGKITTLRKVIDKLSGQGLVSGGKDDRNRKRI